MSKRDVKITADEFANRFFSKGDVFAFSYKNPALLSFLYYTEGHSTVDIADLLGCEQRTVRRYMNYFGFKRFTKDFSLLVKHHGIEDALKLREPTFYPLGIHTD